LEPAIGASRGNYSRGDVYQRGIRVRKDRHDRSLRNYCGTDRHCSRQQATYATDAETASRAAGLWWGFYGDAASILRRAFADLWHGADVKGCLLFYVHEQFHLRVNGA